MTVEHTAGGRTLRLEVVPETGHVELSQTMLGVRIPPPLVLEPAELRWLFLFGAPAALHLAEQRQQQLEGDGQHEPAAAPAAPQTLPLQG